MVMIDDRQMLAGRALDAAFDAADGAAAELDHPLVGIFGHGAPETLISASGSVPVHVNFGRLDGSGVGAIDQLIEPFVDHEVRIFLNRFAAGAFTGFAGIVFVRDDAAALTAYQYATEWVRQGRAPRGTPPLFLFNLVHAASDPVRTFNDIQIEKLVSFLTAIGLDDPEAGLAGATAQAVRRQRALGRVSHSARGARAMVWRNAGRFLAPERHADLLEAAIVEDASPPAPLRLGLVGSGLASADAYAAFAGFGDIVCDLQPFGQIWPGPWECEPSRAAMRDLMAGDPFCLRISPPQRHRQAMLDAIEAARCDLVLCQLAQTDDTFGWEIPGLAKALQARDIGFVNLGFRDAVPGPAWIERARKLIGQALETRP